MKVILIDEDAFFELFNRLVDRFEQQKAKKEKSWLTPQEAMKALNITSKTTLQKYRDEGKIRFAQPSRRVILYDPKSIDAFLEKHARDTF